MTGVSRGSHCSWPRAAVFDRPQGAIFLPPPSQSWNRRPVLFLSIHYHHQDKISCFPDTFDHLAKDEKNKTKLGCFATKISSFSTACSTPPTWAFLFPCARMDRWLKQPLARLSHRSFSGNLPLLCSKLLRTARK